MPQFGGATELDYSTLFAADMSEAEMLEVVERHRLAIADFLALVRSQRAVLSAQPHMACFALLCDETSAAAAWPSRGGRRCDGEAPCGRLDGMWVGVSSGMNPVPCKLRPIRVGKWHTLATRASRLWAAHAGLPTRTGAAGHVGAPPRRAAAHRRRRHALRLGFLAQRAQPRQ